MNDDSVINTTTDGQPRPPSYREYEDSAPTPDRSNELRIVTRDPVHAEMAGSLERIADSLELIATILESITQNKGLNVTADCYQKDKWNGVRT